LTFIFIYLKKSLKIPKG